MLHDEKLLTTDVKKMYLPVWANECELPKALCNMCPTFLLGNAFARWRKVIHD